MQNPTNNKRVLVVDDDPSMVRSLELFLGMEGIEVLTANDGARALEEISAKKPRVVILDALMPFMNGLEVCKQIRAQHGDNDIAVIIFTGYPDRAKEEEMLNSGATAYLTKPCDFDRILSVIRDFL